MAFSETLIQKVWEKGIPVEGQNPSQLRKDSAGAWIMRERYGQEISCGWSIDHIYPTSLGGKDDILNLRPYHWKNNISKANDYPKFKTEVCAVEGGEVQNVEKAENWVITKEFQERLRLLHGR